MGHSIGIDFGTTKTLVSYYVPTTKEKSYVRLGRNMDKMPTSIYVEETGDWLFGDDADDYMSISPARYRRDFKLELGKNTPYLVAKVNGKVQKFTARDLTAKFLGNIRKKCEETVFHAPVTSCTVTHPVAFSIAQCNELTEAAKEAGFKEVQLLPEPEAAGYAYYVFGADRSLSHLMVVDWGGGTVDFAMITLNGAEVALIPGSYGGAMNVGGRRFDERLFSHFSLKIRQAGGGCLEDENNPQISKQICDCKERLSRVASVKQVMLIGEKGQYRTDVSREEFNAVISADVGMVVDKLQELLSRCSEKPQALLLIGGSTAIPVIRERLQQVTGLKCVAWDKGNEAVSLGAAWFASQDTSLDDDARTSYGGATQDNSSRRRAEPPTRSPASAPAVRAWKTGNDLESYIWQQKTLHEDTWLLYRSLMTITWRLNEIHRSANACADELNAINEGDDSKIIVMRVRQGLNAVSIGEFNDVIGAIADAVSGLLFGLFQDPYKPYVELYPGLGQFLKDLPAAPIGSEASLRNDIVRMLGQLRRDYDDICAKYKQVREGFARYDKILTRSSLLKNILVGGVLGWLTGGLGVVAAVAWHGWSGMNDKDYVTNYFNAIQAFLAESADFTDKGLQLVLQLFDRKQNVWEGLFRYEEALLRALNDQGIDLRHVRCQIDESTRDADQEALNSPDTHYAIAAAIDNLRQERHLSEARIKNLAEMSRRQGMLLLPDGRLDESSVQALVPIEEADDSATQGFMRIVEHCRRHDKFYVLDDIPQEKMVNALHDYAGCLKPEDVLCLYDSTVFGSGDTGFVIAQGGVCWKQMWGSPGECTWADMAMINASDPRVGAIHINGCSVDVPAGSAQEFAKLFCSLRKFFSGIDGNDLRQETPKSPARIIPCPHCGTDVSTDSVRCWSCDGLIHV